MNQPEQEGTKILGWPGYRVYKHEINEKAKTLKLWVRRKSGHQKLGWGGCGQRVHDIREIYEREVRDLPWGEYRVDGGAQRAVRTQPPSEESLSAEREFGSDLELPPSRS